MERTPKAYLEELDEPVDLDRRVLGKKTFDRDEGLKGGDDGGSGGNTDTTTKMQSSTDLDSGQMSRESKG